MYCSLLRELQCNFSNLGEGCYIVIFMIVLNMSIITGLKIAIADAIGKAGHGIYDPAELVIIIYDMWVVWLRKQ